MKTLLAAAAICLIACGCAPTASRDQVLAAYDTILMKGTEPGTGLDGEMQFHDDWAFFLGNTVDPTGQAVTPPDRVSSDTVILFRKVRGEWQVIDHGLGISDAFYLDWPQQYGAPKELFE